MHIALQQAVWLIGIEYGEKQRAIHKKKKIIIYGKALLDIAFLEAIELYEDREDMSCFITGFVNGYLQ